MNRLPAIKLNPSTLLSALVAAAIVVFVLNQGKAKQFDVKNVAVNEAKTLIDAGALVIDVRGEQQFNHRHIPGAILVPLTALRQGVPAAIAHAKEKSVVVYCGDGLTHGPEGTQLLNKAGFAKAVNIQAGIEGWAAAGMPVQR